MSAVGEALAAERAAEGLFARVNPHVYLQISFPATLFSTQRTAVQLHAGVAGHVLLQGGAAVAVFTADVTAFWALVRVNVCNKIFSGLQRFPTHSADDICVPGMKTKSVIYQELIG